MTSHEDVTAEIRGQARKWLEADEVRFVVGYEEGPEGVTRPFFARKPEDADRLVWNPRCYSNLTNYMIKELKRPLKRGEEPDPRPVGIVVKPCDSKTIIEMMKEHLFEREKVKIIGINCPGLIDPDKEGDISPETVMGKCLACTHHKPLIADVVFGLEVQETVQDDFSELAAFEDMSEEELWAFWKEQMERCVRCYACREACPLCYCEECVFAKYKPYKWNEKSVALEENVFYHAVRAMHLAGRCIDCGECERVCPMDIPIRMINRFLIKRAKERFDIESGVNVDDCSMFGSYDTGDPGDGIW